MAWKVANLVPRAVTSQEPGHQGVYSCCKEVEIVTRVAGAPLQTHRGGLLGPQEGHQHQQQGAAHPGSSGTLSRRQGGLISALHSRLRGAQPLGNCLPSFIYMNMNMMFTAYT